jgi:hypothetical protein
VSSSQPGRIEQPVETSIRPSIIARKKQAFPQYTAQPGMAASDEVATAVQDERSKMKDIGTNKATSNCSFRVHYA